MKKIFKIMGVLICLTIYGALRGAAEESSVMQGKIRASVGGSPPIIEPPKQETAPAANPLSPQNNLANPASTTGAAPVYPFPFSGMQSSPQALFPGFNTNQNVGNFPVMPTPPNVENPSATSTAPTEMEIQQAIQKYIMDVIQTKGVFEFFDPILGKARKLNFIGIEGVSQKMGSGYRSLAKFQDVEVGEIVDINIDVQGVSGQLNVVGVNIGKVNNQERVVNNPGSFPVGIPAAGTETPNQLPAIFSQPNSPNTIANQ